MGPPDEYREPPTNTIRHRFSKAAFKEFVRDSGKPMLAGLLGNAHDGKLQGDRVVLFFDPSQANLVPMMKSPMHAKDLKKLLADFMGRPLDIGFEKKRDPNLVQALANEDAMLKEITSHPNIKFVLEQFNGTIVKCEPKRKKE